MKYVLLFLLMINIACEKKIKDTNSDVGSRGYDHYNLRTKEGCFKAGGVEYQFNTYNNSGTCIFKKM